MNANPQIDKAPKFLIPLLPKIQDTQETQRREIIENLLRYHEFIDRPSKRAQR